MTRAFFSPSNIPIVDPAVLLFHTKFAGLTLDAGHYEATQKDWHQDFVESVDTVTGYDIVADMQSLFGSSTVTDIFSISQANVATSGEFATYFSSRIDATEGLVLETLQAHGTYPTYSLVPQTMLQIRRSAAQALEADINEACFVMRFKLPADLDLSGNPSAGRYATIIEFKSGGYDGIGGIGDLRIEFMINAGLSPYTNEWRLLLDNKANGVGVIPSLPTNITYYNHRPGIIAELGVWNTAYLYFNRSKGRLTAAVQVDGQAVQIIGDVYPSDLTALGGQLYGLELLPWTRIEACMWYATAYYPSSITVSDLQIWDKSPVHLG